MVRSGVTHQLDAIQTPTNPSKLRSALLLPYTRANAGLRQFYVGSHAYRQHATPIGDLPSDDVGAVSDRES